jgi:probable addiction module antidote protein
LTPNVRSLEISLNAALRTADVHTICAAIDTAVHRSPNVSRLAGDAGLDRSWLYRAFRFKEIGPRLDHAIKILSALGFRLVVKFGRQPKSRPNAMARSRGPDVHIELRSNSKLIAAYLTRAFETSEIAAIVAAFSDVLRAQENVMEFAEKTIRARQSLYRAFTPPCVPRLSTVVSFLDALGLRLAVKPHPKAKGK